MTFLNGNLGGYCSKEISQIQIDEISGVLGGCLCEWFLVHIRAEYTADWSDSKPFFLQDVKIILETTASHEVKKPFKPLHV